MLNRPNGYKSAGDAGPFLHVDSHLWKGVLTQRVATDEFIKGFQVFDKDGTGYIGVGELRFILTSLGEKLSDDEVDELLKGISVGPCVLLLSVSVTLLWLMLRANAQRWQYRLQAVCRSALDAVSIAWSHQVRLRRCQHSVSD